MPSPLHRWAAACTDQALSRPVPDDAAAFAARKGVLRMAWRTARRRLQLRLSGQSPMRRPRFDVKWRRILWIHEGMPQIGDALMDLAPRSLLTERGIQVDLYAPRHIAELFEHDAWFSHSYHQPHDVQADHYDAVIVLSDARKALATKRERLAALPWVSLQGDYDGPDFHRARYATQRLGDVLGRVPDPTDVVRHSAQKLRVTVDAAARAAASCPAPNAVALVLGGVQPERTYRRWPELIEALRLRGVSRFMLLGTDNGRQMADRVRASAGSGVELFDFVGRTSVLDAHALLARAAAVVCADGGLMHVALTTLVPIVALFNSAVDPCWRLPVGREGSGIRSASPDLDGLSPQSIAEAVVNAMRTAASASPEEDASAAALRLGRPLT